MTVSSSTSSVTFAGNGVSTVFPFSFPIPGSSPTDQSNLLVVLADTTVTPATLTVLPTSAWSVTGISTPTSPSSGGAVTYPLSGSPLIAGKYLTIQRNIAQTQGISIPNQSAFFSAVVEGGLDYLTMLVQQLQAQVSRSLQVAVADPGGVPATLPLAATRANMGLAFDGTGNPIAGALPSVAVSVAMQPVFQAATLAAGRTALGAAAAGVGWTLLATATASASASLDFTFTPATYDEIVFEIVGLVPTIDNTDILFRVSTDGGATFKAGASDYGWSLSQAISAGPAVQAAAAVADTSITVKAGLSSTVARALSGQARLYNPNTTTQRCTLAASGFHQNSSGSFTAFNSGGQYVPLGTAINAARFIMSSGTIALGTIRAYGVAKS